MTDAVPPTGSTSTLEGTEWSVSLPGQVLSIIEIPLLLLLAYGFVTALGSQSYAVQPAIYPPIQTYVNNGVPGYLAAWLILATVLVLVALIVVAVALFQRVPVRKIRLLMLGNFVAAGAAGLGVAGATFLHSVWTWNTVPAAPYAIGSSSPTVSGVFAQLLLSLAGGAGASLLPFLVVFIMYRTQRIAANR